MGRTVIDFARNVVNSTIDNTFVDQFENSVLETEEDIEMQVETRDGIATTKDVGKNEDN